MLEKKDNNYNSRDVLDFSPDGLIGTNNKNIIIIFNKQAEKLFGYKSKEIIGQPLSLILPKHIIEIPHIFSNSIELKEMYGLHKNGSDFNIKLSHSQLDTDNGYILVLSIRKTSEKTAIIRELEDSKKQLENFFEISPESIIIHDFKVITHLNKAALDLLKYTDKSELIGKPPIKTIFYSEDIPLIKQIRNELLEKKKVFIPTIRLLNRKGIKVNTELHVSLIIIDGIPHAQIISRDISKREELEKKLATNIQLLKDAEKLAHLGSWKWDIKSNITTWSDEACRIYDLDKKNFNPTSEIWLKTIHPEDIERVQSLTDSLFINKKKIDFEYRIIRPNGEERTLKSWISLKLDKKQNPINMSGATLDITEQNKIKVKLKKSELNFKRFFDMAPIGIALSKLDGKFVDINKEFESFTGYSKKELSNLTYWELTPEKYSAQEAEQLKSINTINAYGPYEKNTYIKMEHFFLLC